MKKSRKIKKATSLGGRRVDTESRHRVRLLFPNTIYIYKNAENLTAHTQKI